jgi:acyl-CoA synthetase (NDP forming)
MKLSAAAAIERIINPRSVVVIGANDRPHSMTSGPLVNLARHGFSGKAFAVNPKRETVLGIPSFPRVAALPEVPDTAVLVVSAGQVPQVLEECASFGIATATVIASGFDEGAVGKEGDALGREVRDVLDRTGLRLLGPNTAGLMNVVDNYVPRAVVNHPATLKPGRVGIVTQSGGLSNTLFNRALVNDVGIAYCVATGNQMDLGLWDIADFMVDDPRVSTILTIIEGFKQPERFEEVATRAARAGKPIVALKLGTTDAGGRMAATHSGALAGSAMVQAAVMDELGVIRAHDIDQLWEVAQLLDRWPTPGPIRTAGVITSSGGAGIIAADALSSASIDLPLPSPASEAALRVLFPAATINNPLDSAAVLASRGTGTTEQLVAGFAADPAFDMTLLTIPVSAWVATLPEQLEGLRSSGASRIAISVFTAGEHTEQCMSLLRASGFPIFEDATRAAAATRLVSLYAEWRAPLAPPAPPKSALPPVADEDVPMPYWLARQALERIGVPFNDAELVTDVEAAVGAARRIGYPVSLKLSSAKVIHKLAAKAIYLFIRDDAGARAAAEALLAVQQPLGPFAEGEGIVVEQYVESLLAAFVGGHRDPEFGPMIMVGLGGSLAEAYGDVCHVRCPVDREQAARALASTRFGKIIGRMPGAGEALTNLVARMSSYFAASPNVRSFDINPVLVRSDGRLAAVDGRIQSD